MSIQTALIDMDLKPLHGHAALSGFSADMIKTLLDRTSAEPHSASMFMQMYYILDHLDFTDLALEMQDKALSFQRVFRVRNNNQPSGERPLRLLALVGRGNLSDNAPLDYITDHCNIQLDLLYILDDLHVPAEIPDHDAVIVALGEKDCHLDVLHFLKSIKSAWPKPWLNDPSHITQCARHLIYQRLKDIPNLIVPETIRIQRPCATLPFYPATIRPIDTHSGKGLVLVRDQAELEFFLDNTDTDQFYVSRFYQTERNDGLYRKIRIALIDGKPYICHVALSDQWVVHYISAKMHLNEDKIREEQAIMEQFDRKKFEPLRDTLSEIAQAIGLDYVVLDCEITRDNKIILFEADNRGWIHSTDSETIFPYKKPIMAKAFSAFRSMIMRHARIPASNTAL